MRSRALPAAVLTAAAAAFLLPSALPAQSPSVEALIEAGHWRRARAAAELMLKASPANPRAMVLLGRCLDVAGDLDGALAQAEKAVAADPASADAHALLAYIQGRRAQGAGVLRQIGLARRIRREAEKALALAPRHVEAHLILIEFYRQAPGIVGGDKERARRLVEELTAIAPARGYIAQAGFLWHEQGAADRMDDLYRKALAAEPASYPALTALARSYASSRSKRFVEGDALARRAIELAPDRAEAYGILAQSLVLQGRAAELDSVLKEVEAQVPDNASPVFQAARAVQQKGEDFAAAESLLRRYLAREPELGAPSHAQAWWRLGQILEKLGRKPEAEAATRRALALDPRLARAGGRDPRRG